MATRVADDDEVGKRLKELLAQEAPLGQEHDCTCGATQRCRCFLPPPQVAPTALEALHAAAVHVPPHVVCGQGDENASDD